MPRKLLLIDTSFLKYLVYFMYYKTYEMGGIKRDSKKIIKFCKAEMDQLLAPVLNKFPTGVPVFLFDKKEQDIYWRQKWIDNHSDKYQKLWKEYNAKIKSRPITDTRYKGGRKEKSEYNSLFPLTEKACELYKLNFYLCLPGLEADDWASLICRLKPQKVSIELVTVDRDWSLLVDDSKKISFVNMHFKNRYNVETQEQVVDYFQRKLSPKITHPKEAAKYKSELGELGDNLPPGADLELIDLTEYAALYHQKEATKLVQELLKCLQIS